MKSGPWPLSVVVDKVKYVGEAEAEAEAIGDHEGQMHRHGTQPRNTCPSSSIFVRIEEVARLL